MPARNNLANKLRRFNEGGADCPPKLETDKRNVKRRLASMKGGRTAPRNLHAGKIIRWKTDASMKGGRTAPRNDAIFDAIDATGLASMKGGRTAPRNPCAPPLCLCPRRRFNEGGADCPPKRRKLNTR